MTRVTQSQGEIQSDPQENVITLADIKELDGGTKEPLFCAHKCYSISFFFDAPQICQNRWAEAAFTSKNILLDPEVLLTRQYLGLELQSSDHTWGGSGHRIHQCHLIIKHLDLSHLDKAGCAKKISTYSSHACDINLLRNKQIVNLFGAFSEWKLISQKWFCIGTKYFQSKITLSTCFEKIN